MAFAKQHSAWLLPLLCVAGCSNESGGLQTRDALVCTEVRKDFPVAATPQLDILLVVDNSRSMSDKASALTANLHRFANVLENIEGGLPDLHIAVVASSATSASLGAFESAATIEGCTPPTGAFLVDTVFANGEREHNYGESLGDALACVGSLPPIGQAIEQPLEAMRAALNGSIAGNAGFLRENAFLFVLIISDEDDCSGGLALQPGSAESNSAWSCFADAIACLEPVDTPGIKSMCEALPAPASLTPVDAYVDFLRARKEDQSQVLVATVSARPAVEVADASEGLVLQSTCEGSTSAKPGIRLDTFRSRFPQRNTYVDVCAAEWSDALTLFARPLTFSQPWPQCISESIDLEPDTAGIQHQCTVSQFIDLGGDAQIETLLPECLSAAPEESEKPCWRIEENLLSCAESGGFEFLVERGREQLPPGITVSARCHAGC